jgi:hypothetical protein
VIKCKKGWGQWIGSFSEALLVVNTYRAELLSLMAIHLILLSVDRVHSSLSGSVEVLSDCLPYRPVFKHQLMFPDVTV